MTGVVWYTFYLNLLCYYFGEHTQEMADQPIVGQNRKLLALNKVLCFPSYWWWHLWARSCAIISSTWNSVKLNLVTFWNYLYVSSVVLEKDPTISIRSNGCEYIHIFEHLLLIHVVCPGIPCPWWKVSYSSGFVYYIIVMSWVFRKSGTAKNGSMGKGFGKGNIQQ